MAFRSPIQLIGSPAGEGSLLALAEQSNGPNRGRSGALPAEREPLIHRMVAPGHTGPLNEL